LYFKKLISFYSPNSNIFAYTHHMQIFLKFSYLLKDVKKSLST